jgi:seryl-tRNA(Sec) selenium transferase
LGKLDLFVLEDRLRKHLAGEPSEVDAMLEVSFEALQKRTEAFSNLLKEKGIQSQIRTGRSPIGGGSTPDEEIESCLLEIQVTDSEVAARKLSQFRVPVFIRKEKGKVALDLRTVFQKEEPLLLEALQCLS